jgi:transcriptional regulator GlxA family with amidase domain
MPRTVAPRRVAILAFPGVQSLDLTGPLEVFDIASRLIAATRPGERAYEVQVISQDGAPLETSSGLRIVPHAALFDDLRGLDTLVIAGGTGTRAAARDAALIEWIARAASKARRTASVCTGAFLLASAGLLDGRRAATHWSAAQRLAALHPLVHVDAEPIYLRDGNIWTSAGVTAGMDLSLALVEEDLDRDAALTIARHLVLFLRRPGNQAQFSATLAAQEPGRDALREAQRLVVEQPAGEHTIEAMAARAHMSARHFARAFRAETGITPARYVERVRLEAARRGLEETSQSIALIASACGFGTAETMRRSFLRALQVGPAEYRRRFRSVAAGEKPGADSRAAA